ncbi:MAG TPA: sugar phosphate isomerase/epimerase [Thermoleophilaceae bacterium]
MNVELANAYWTSAGPVEVHAGKEWSDFDFADRCAEAARAGFAGLGLWHSDIEHQLPKRSLRDMRRILDDNGVRCFELEFLMDWFLDEGDEARQAADRTRAMLFEAANELDAHHIKAGNIPGHECEAGRLHEAYAALVEDAAGHTSTPVLYEFMPFDANVKSIESALALIDGVPNTGLVIDTWHMAKLGIAPEDLRKIPLEQLGWIELSDGQVENMEDPVDETVNHRRLPGEGEFDIRGYVEVGLDMGYSDVWGVEVLSQELRSYPLDEMYRRTYQAAAAQFEAVTA